MINLSELAINQVHSAYTTGTFTAIELVQAYLDRIKSPDKTGPRLNFILAQPTTALQEADDLDGYLRTTGGLKEGLHSIPTIIEDQIETKGIITIFGSIVEKHHVPDEDAAPVQKLKNSGAVVIAKSTMPGEDNIHTQ